MDRFGLFGGFENVERSICFDFEVCTGILYRSSDGHLTGSVNDSVVTIEDLLESIFVPNVGFNQVNFRVFLFI